MSRRRRAREAAMQVLFQADFDRAADLSEIKERFWEDHPADAETRAFADDLVEGTTAHREEIDGLLRRISEHWSVSRMSPVDRNLIRSAIYELLYKETPSRVVINEAIEIAKRYGTEESGAFVNGILDRVAKEAHVG
ncbi:MAG: transcription antitermination factor NusB [Nitrospirae bacterium]|nr:transcription antitermination factor NusB [Nitrospirota bacterium]MBI3392700.1 transcription antitermination factor NusB [Nitrospirota bacterium]